MVVEVNSSSGGYRRISWRRRMTTHLQSLASTKNRTRFRDEEFY